MNDIKQIVANNIIKYRKRAKLTQVELAEKLNYSDKAISKWERGDSLPDIIILNNLAKLFNVTLDSLISNKEEKAVKGFKHYFQKFYSGNMLITLGSSLIAWLVATVAFVMLSLFTDVQNLWMIFIYTLPINCIILIIFNYLWKNIYYNFIAVSLLIISLAVCSYLTLFLFFNISKIWLIFIILIPLLVLTYLWFIVRNKYN